MQVILRLDDLQRQVVEWRQRPSEERVSAAVFQLAFDEAVDPGLIIAMTHQELREAHRQCAGIRVSRLTH